MIIPLDNFYTLITNLAFSSSPLGCRSCVLLQGIFRHICEYIYMNGVCGPQAHYPERLGRLFMMHVPYVFWGVWKIVSPFVDQVTRENVRIAIGERGIMEWMLGLFVHCVDGCWQILFVEDKSLEDSLKKDISPDMLPQEYGGTGALVLIDKVNIPDRLSEKSGS